MWAIVLGHLINECQVDPVQRTLRLVVSPTVPGSSGIKI